MGGHSERIRNTMAWPRENETAFIAILYERLKKEKLQCSTFTKDEWGKINEELKVVTLWDYGIERLKGKWNRLRIAYRLFTSLIEHTGVTWDPNTNEVHAAEEVWNHFYTINKSEYKTFKKEGFRNYEILREIFRGTLVIGGLHNASTEQPPNSDEEKMMEDVFLNKRTYAQLQSDDEVSTTQSGPSHTKRRRKDKKVKKSKKSEKSSKYDNLRAIWASTASEKSAESTLRQQYLQKKLSKLEEKENQKNKEDDLYSIESCMKILNSMDNISDDVYAIGAKALIADVNFRKGFMNMSEHRRGPFLDRL